jgi:hypothetical protein
MQRVSPAIRRTILWLVAVVPAVLLVFGVYNAGALPGCKGCHDEATFVAGTRNSAHADVDCIACHVGTAPADRVSFGFREAFHMTLPVLRGTGRDWQAVPDSRCLTCHEAIQDTVTTSGGIRIAHASCALDSLCSDCHSTTAHGAATSWVRVYDMETCLACHVSKASTKCDLCHEGRLPSNRVTSGVFAITHGPQWQKTHGMGNATTCTVCHTAANCEKCHGAGLPHGVGFLKEHSGFATSKAARCRSCHEPRFCSDCHGLTMPHTTAFTRGHAADAKKDAALCKRCHADPDCTKCHAIGSGGGT